MVAALFAAIAVLGAQPLKPAIDLKPDAKPAMFMVGDQDTTVYVFGTFHALDGKADWFDGPVRTAFDGSNELILETIVPESPAAPPLGLKVPPIGGPVASSASFLAASRTVIAAGKSQGMQVDKGADMVLRREARNEGKAVEGLETLESQLAMFASLTEEPVPLRPATATSPNAVPSLAANLPQTMTNLQQAWSKGDQRLFAAMLNDLKRSAPVTYRRMFADRNGRWADWIRGRMQYPGVVFVAVGAGHLAGPDSLLVRLAQIGIPSRRVN